MSGQTYSSKISCLPNNGYFGTADGAETKHYSFKQDRSLCKNGALHVFVMDVYTFYIFLECLGIWNIDTCPVNSQTMCLNGILKIFFFFFYVDIRS